MRIHSFVSRCTIIVFAICMVSAMLCAGELSFRTIALKGDEPVSTNGLKLGDLVTDAVIGSNGEVAFWANLAPSNPNQTDWLFGAWLSRDGIIKSIIQTNGNFSDSFSILPDGSIYGFNCERGIDSAVILVQDNQITNIAKTGDHPPGTPVGTTWNQPGSYLNFYTNGYSENGTLQFHGATVDVDSPTTRKIGIWNATGSTTQLLVREGDAAVGLPTGSTIKQIDWSAFSSSGKTVFAATLDGSAINSTNDKAVWFGTPGNVQKIIQKGDAAPGLPSGFSFTRIDMGLTAGQNIDAQDRVLFRGQAESNDPNNSTDPITGYWLGNAGAFQPISLPRDQAPGLPTGITKSPYIMQINNRGELLEIATLDRTYDFPNPTVGFGNDKAIYRGTPGNMDLILRTGDPAPGLGPNVFFDWSIHTNLGIPFSDNGEILFYIKLVGANVTKDVNDQSVWFVDHEGEMRLVARSGDLFDIGDGVMKKIRAFQPYSLSTDGWINEKGEFVFSCFFDDQTSGIFAAQVVPEPILIVPVAAIAFLIIRKARSRRNYA